MRITVTLSANAGVAIDMGGRRIWVDALHEQKQKNFSPVTPQLQQKMLHHEAFFHPEYICYTHCHGDHYSETLTDAAQQLWPNAKVMAPEGKYFAVEGAGSAVENRGLRLRFMKLLHEGVEFRDVRHYGLLISYQGVNVLIPGDCAVASEELLRAMGDTRIDLVLLDFPWITLLRGREFVLRYFSECRVLIHHIPFSFDDVCGYRDVIRSTAKAMTGISDLRLMLEPLQQEIYNI